MATTSEEWLEAYAQQQLATQRATADDAKLVATFAAALAGSLLASALQEGEKPSGWDWVSSVALSLTVLLTLLVTVILDRFEEPDYAKVQQSALQGSWSDAHQLFELRQATIAARNVNQAVVTKIIFTMWAQLLAAVFTGATAALSMLLG
ncbi:hypothetical protein [Geodermatophilus sp. URMC 63]